MTFHSKIFLHPGLYNSGEQHWQTHWENTYGFERIRQDDWQTPVCADWIARLDDVLCREDLRQVIVVGHSLACATIGYWAQHYQRVIKGALLVAPSDTEAPSYPEGTTGFRPMPTGRLPFPSIVVTSADDPYVSPARARQFADAWGSAYVELDGLGHINSDSNLGNWDVGAGLLAQLDAGLLTGL
ncbi:MAG: alpha/beta hydrolase [Saprospiraceae bacterium]|nr:alpha/beta hydrolase [Saprospiraceae bacterium]